MLAASILTARPLNNKLLWLFFFLLLDVVHASRMSTTRSQMFLITNHSQLGVLKWSDGPWSSRMPAQKPLIIRCFSLFLGLQKGQVNPLETIIVFYNWRFRTSYKLYTLLAEKEELQKALILERCSNCSTKTLWKHFSFQRGSKWSSSVLPHMVHITSSSQARDFLALQDCKSISIKRVMFYITV